MTTLNASHMRAAFVREAGPADQIIVGDVPIPRPGPGSVLVHNTILAVNHVDTYIRAGSYATARPVAAGEPFIIGRDLAGTVAEVGAGVTSFAVGDAVWCNSLGYDGRQGSFSDYSLVPAERLYPLPSGVTPETVVSVAHTGATAYFGLVREAQLCVGETVFIGGAAGGVGSAAVQLARAAGARVLASCAPHDAEWVRSCGADEVFDSRDAALLDRVYAAAPAGVNVWWDTTGRLELARYLPLVSHGGRIIVTAGLTGSQFTLAPGDLYTRDVQLRGFATSNASAADLAAAAAAVSGLLTRGSLKSRVAKVLSLEEAAGAHRLMESRTAPGKLLVKPGSVRPKPHAPGARVGGAQPAGAAAGAAGSSDGTGPGAMPKPGVTAKPGAGAAAVQPPAASAAPHPAAPKPGPQLTTHTTESAPRPTPQSPTPPPPQPAPQPTAQPTPKPAANPPAKAPAPRPIPKPKPKA